MVFKNISRRYAGYYILSSRKILTTPKQPTDYRDDDNLYPASLQNIAGISGSLSVSHSNLIPKIASFREALISAWSSQIEFY